MKKYLLFIVILLSNQDILQACGFSLYGEDIRYSLFYPEYFNYSDFKAFQYNANLFGFDSEYKFQYESNVNDWFDYTEGKVPIDEINECLNTLTLTDINEASANEFVRYLYKNRRNDVLRYLVTAKKCEELNNFDHEDPWERGISVNRNTSAFLAKLLTLTDTEKSVYLKRKYAFLTIRTAYYDNNFDLIKTLFNKHFAGKQKDYLYYWALYFNAFQNKNASIDVANVMANSAEKKHACYYYFHEGFNLNDALLKAKNETEKANAYAFASVQRLEPNLDYVKKIYTHNSKSRILDFLLLREINKIEDWVYTPYYTNFLPSVEYGSSWANSGDIIQTTNVLRNRSEKDRLYAAQVLEFINTVNYSMIIDVPLWKAAQIQLLFITRDYDQCLTKIDAFERQFAKEKVFEQIEKIKALCIISNQEKGRAVIRDEAKPIILKYLNDAHFLFSAGRELEYLGNIPDGMALIAYSDKKAKSQNGYSSSLSWEGNRLKNSAYLEYFSSYFDYLDFVYTADELQTVVNKLETKISDDFYPLMYCQLLDDKNSLKDLLGTKYIRENRLHDAERVFSSVNSSYWEKNYNSWGDDQDAVYAQFNQNPFYDIKYTKSFIPHTDKFVVTKLSITQHLIKFLSLANNPKNPDRDYYYFIVGNCYLSMTQYGHSWMMRRFISSSDYDLENETYIDESEYRNSALAKKYYRLAYKHARKDRFKALCLKMEDYAQNNIGSRYVKLKRLYPAYYKELSGCDHLEAYFKSRR